MSAFPPSMRIILDHNTPAPVRYWLIGHAVETAYERGWAELINGELLAAAEAAGFADSQMAFTHNDRSLRLCPRGLHRSQIPVSQSGQRCT